MDPRATTSHHDRCFGCGQANLFGLLLDVEHRDDGGLRGRWFVKQDHQGPAAGSVHPGLVACGLIEAALLAAGPERELRQVQCDLPTGAVSAVGAFCEVAVRLDSASLRATAAIDGQPVGEMTAGLGPRAVT